MMVNRLPEKNLISEHSKIAEFGPFFSSPELEVLMVSYCDQSMSVVRRASCVVRRQQFVLKANSS